MKLVSGYQVDEESLDRVGNAQLDYKILNNIALAGTYAEIIKVERNTYITSFFITDTKVATL